jgi:hypothetical protein
MLRYFWSIDCVMVLLHYCGDNGRVGEWVQGVFAGGETAVENRDHRVLYETVQDLEISCTVFCMEDLTVYKL